jgi:hypothetical protein
MRPCMAAGRTVFPRLLLAIGIGALLGAGAPAGAAPGPSANPRGYVDGAAFAQLAREDAELVEVNVSGALLQALANSVSGEDQEAGRIISRLASIHAVVAEIDPAQVEAATARIESTAKDLLAKGWEEVAKVRNKGERVRVLLLNDDGHIKGVAVMILDRDEKKSPQVVFANIAGTINLAELEKIRGRINVPGLDEVTGHAGDKESGTDSSTKQHDAETGAGGHSGTHGEAP